MSCLRPGGNGRSESSQVPRVSGSLSDVTADTIQRALAEITAEADPTLKHLTLASLVSAIFRERGIELVVVGGSAIEFYTEGAYVSGDLDLCVMQAVGAPSTRLRQELMGLLSAQG